MKSVTSVISVFFFITFYNFFKFDLYHFQFLFFCLSLLKLFFIASRIMAYMCPRCDIITETLTKLFEHMKLKHHSTFDDVVHCKQPECTRFFCDIYSFKKHLKNKHNILYGDATINDESLNGQLGPDINKIVKSNLSINLSNSGSSILHDVNESESSSLRSLEINSHHHLTVKEFRGSITESLSMFISKLYSNGNFTKSAIEEIIKMTTELFNSPFVDMLKNEFIAFTDGQNQRRIIDL